MARGIPRGGGCRGEWVPELADPASTGKNPIAKMPCHCDKATGGEVIDVRQE